jgi:PPK2 family polyphosphate:nucleotide phosphotransferase
VKLSSAREKFRVGATEAASFVLSSIDPGATPGMSKAKASKEIEKDRKLVADLQERLYAENERSLLLVLQGMDTSGKDGTITHVIGSMNPQGSRITAFKAPTRTEAAHDFLWRIRKALPPPRYVGVFNRSHYEDVGVVRVHGLVPEKVWRARYGKINTFEKEVAASGTTIVKVFLHISFEEQRRRLSRRLDDGTKRWKFDQADLSEREYWDDYMAAYAEAIERCSTGVAPWFVVPADAKWYRNWAVNRLLIETLEAMDPRYPQPALDIPALKARLERSRRRTSG